MFVKLCQSPENKNSYSHRDFKKHIGGFSPLPRNKITLSPKHKPKSNFSEISSIIKEIPLHYLNDYYNLETSIFRKKIETLNSQFFYTYESALNNNNNTVNNNTEINSNQILIFPYEKLFLILFKEISLYIDEIIRLNKKLNAKNKNEKYFIKKIDDYKIKEKEYYLNKQIIKNLERNIKNLEKNNQKIKNENEKLNKKLFTVKYASMKSFDEYNSCKNFNNYRYKNYQKANTIYSDYYGYNNLTEQGSYMNLLNNNDYKKRYSLKTFANKSKSKISNKSSSKDFFNNMNRDSNIKLINSCSRNYDKSENNNNYFENKEINDDNKDNKNILYLSINQCEDEIKNLNMIEDLLLNYQENDIKNDTKSLTKEKNKTFNKFMNTPKKFKFNYRHNENTTAKKIFFTDKRFKKMNKSLDYKSKILTVGKKY